MRQLLAAFVIGMRPRSADTCDQVKTKQFSHAPVVQVDGGPVADALGTLHKVQSGQCLRRAHS